MKSIAWAAACSMAIIFLSLGVPAEAQIHGSFQAGGEPLAAPAKGAAPVPTFALLLPRYYADPSSSGGASTLFSVRNRSTENVAVEAVYFDRSGLSVRIERFELGPHELRPVNVRDLGLPLDPVSRRIEGTMLLTAVDAQGEIVAENVLSGDAFLVDPINDFASGTSLLDAVDDFCNRWDLRFFNGGLFSGGTEMVFLFPFGGPEVRVVAEGNVYDEQGGFLGIATVSAAGVMASINSSDFEPPLPLTGVIEWQFAEGELGSLSGTLDAQGRFSVGLPALCADS